MILLSSSMSSPQKAMLSRINEQAIFPKPVYTKDSSGAIISLALKNLKTIYNTAKV